VALQNRVALVTGAARGMGREIALALGRSGMHIAVSYRSNKAGAEKVLSELKSRRGPISGPQDLAVATDVTDPRRVKELLDAVVRHFGRLDVLINNVGDFEWKAVVDSSIAEWHSILASNLFSVFYTCKYALPAMRKQHWGRIINMGSVGAERGFGQAKISAYSAAKSGMIAFSRSLALEEARHGITVNVVNPPIMDDKDLSLEEALRVTDARFPAGRPPSIQDIAGAVLFFASEESSFITGQVLTVSGGWML
jgi:NAD(P)-dependent dehydrogenase (short-subunit alcohol dehydrogenase family)